MKMTELMTGPMGTTTTAQDLIANNHYIADEAAAYGQMILSTNYVPASETGSDPLEPWQETLEADLTRVCPTCFIASPVTRDCDICND